MTNPPHISRTLALGAAAGAALASTLALQASPALADVKARVQNGTLQINGDAAADRLALGADATTLVVDVGADGTPDFTFPRSTFSAIAIAAGGGDDEVRIENSVGTTPTPITIKGGAGDDTLIGGQGDETIDGGGGDDTIDGNRGSDTVSMGAGADRFTWDPGDGSDTVDGQGGKDTLDFNGSNAAERIGVFADGSRVRLTRDVAAITMDLDGIDALNVRTLGSADVTTIGDLTGTDLRAADVDLNAFDGSGDGAADSVIVDGTDHADQVDVGTDAGDAVVSGLATTVRVTGGEPANDRLDVATLGGDDTLNAGVDVTAPVAVHLAGGEGADSAVYQGSAGDDAISVALNGTEVAAFAPGTSVVDTATENLDVRGGPGADAITGSNGIAARTALTVEGNAGDDTLAGGDGDDLLLGGGGDDTIDGNRGDDTALMGGGADRFVWDPGDGSDTVEGQAGRDTLAFNGSNIGEQIDVSANGPRVRLTRNVAAITMDLGGVDALALRALGGADVVTLNDLSGTDLDTAAVDLSASTGGGDEAADAVVQNGTAKADRVRITRAGDGVAVDGLQPQTTITGSEAANDHLQLNTLAGDDTVTLGSGVGDVIAPAIDLGADQ